MKASPTLTVAPPKRLGRYEVGAKIGGGGMATVYVGRSREGQHKDELVALKVIRDELAHDENFSSMFIDEAKILARLSHPNVIHTLEYGITGHHRFIAMELLNGRTYADVWDKLAHDKAKMPLALGAWICARTAEGLHSAHELVDESGAALNVIHRDVNPTNVFLTHTGEVKLIDFGLAKARKRVSKSQDGVVKGKIPYLAPEQARGHAIDRRIDVYALGTTLWETATMKRLFKRDTDVDTLKAIRDAHVPDPRETIPGFPDALWEIMDKALRRDRDERYATAEEMRAALDAFVGDQAPKMKGALTELLERLFPGEDAEQAKWMRQATALRIPSDTMPPPAPVPIASSSLLEDVESAPEFDPARTKPTPAAGRAPEDDDRAPPSARPKKPKKAREKRRSQTKRRAHDRASARSVTAPAGEDKRRLWIVVGGVVVVLIVLALVFGSR